MTRAPKFQRQQWKAAKRVRRAKRLIERALWTRDTGYGRGQRFHDPSLANVYKTVSEVLGVLETRIRILEGRCD